MVVTVPVAAVNYYGFDGLAVFFEKLFHGIFLGTVLRNTIIYRAQWKGQQRGIWPFAAGTIFSRDMDEIAASPDRTREVILPSTVRRVRGDAFASKL